MNQSLLLVTILLTIASAQIFEEQAAFLPHPERCLKKALNFTKDLKTFIREERNHSLTPEQTFNAIWDLLNDIPVVLTDCDLPVPAIFNNTGALRNCTVALYDLYEDVVKIDNDWNNQDYKRVLEDISATYKAAVEIQQQCQAHNFFVAEAQQLQHFDEVDIFLSEDEEEDNDEDDEKDLELSFDFENNQFNITECLQQSELVAKDLDSLLTDVKQAREHGLNPVEIESITKDTFTLLDNILYDFVPACAGSAAEDEIEHYLPQVCLTAIENVTLLIEDIAEHDRDVQFILTALPQLYDDLVAIGKNCENTIGLFLKPFYTAADNIKNNIMIN